MRTFIRPPRRPSQSAREVAFLLGARLLRRNNSRYRYRSGDRIINWGNPLPMEGVPWIAQFNHPEAVRIAIDKVATWERLAQAEVPTVTWTRDHSEALRWMREEDQRVLHRTMLHASQGRGIDVYSNSGTDWTRPMYELDEGGVYVQAFGRNPQHVTEYRVAVCDGEVIDFAQKKRRKDYEGRINPYVRSHRNGWVFCREGVECPQSAYEAAIDSTQAVGLDFGSVDLGVHREGGVCVYEINTAPGIEGTSHARWADALSRILV